MQGLRNKAYTLARKSERFIKTDMVYLIKNGSALSFSQIFSAVITLALSSLFANLIPPKTYGEYKLVLSVLTIASVFGLNGIGTAVFQAVARKKEGILHRVIYERIKWGILTQLVGIGLGVYYLLWSDTPDIGRIVLLISSLLPFYNTYIIHDSFLKGRKEFVAATKYSIIIKFINSALMAAALFLTSDVLVLVFIYFAAAILTHYITFTLVVKRYKPNNEYDPEAIGYSKHLSIIGGLSTLSGHLYQVVLFNQLGAVALAIFSFAYAPVKLIISLLKSATAIFFPHFSQDSWKVGSFKRFFKKLIPFILFSAFAALAYILVAPFLFDLLFEPYNASIPITIALAGLVVFFGLNNILLSIIRAKKYIRAYYTFSIIISTLNLVVNTILLILYNLRGLVVGIYIIQIISLVMLTAFISIQERKDQETLNQG